MAASLSTTKGKKRGRSRNNQNPATAEYVDQPSDIQDYSTRGLGYDDESNVEFRRMNGAVMNNIEFKGERGYYHVTALENLLQSTMANLVPHKHNMDGGILNSKLKPVVQTNKSSKKPMVKVWALPWGWWPSCIFHVYTNHIESLMRSNRWIPLILIAKDNPRMSKFVPFGTGGRWAHTCHPAYTANKIPVGIEDIVSVHYQHLPGILVDTMVHSDIVLLLANEEKSLSGKDIKKVLK